MFSFQLESDIVITCPKFLSVYLEREVRELGFSVQERFATGLRLRGTLNDCIRLNLNLYCASQVLYSLSDFTAADADEVYQILSDMPWETLVDPSTYLSVTGNVFHPTINNSMYANLRVKDAIVDRLRRRTGQRPPTGANLEGAVFHLFWKYDKAEIFVDTSGPSLGRHGYRKIPGRAPMLEALAAAVLMATRWQRETSLVNPMCGSGTLAIEAALLAGDRRPGLFRDDFAFMHLRSYNPAFYLQERENLERRVRNRLPSGMHIIASDHSEAAVNNARKNAEAAGVASLIDFELCDFAATTLPQPPGAVILNPEYGLRLGDMEALTDTYRRISNFLKQQCAGYWGYVFTGNRDLARHIGLRPTRRIEFYNAKIDCRLLEYELYTGSKQ